MHYPTLAFDPVPLMAGALASGWAHMSEPEYRYDDKVHEWKPAHRKTPPQHRRLPAHRKNAKHPETAKMNKAERNRFYVACHRKRFTDQGLTVWGTVRKPRSRYPELVNLYGNDYARVWLQLWRRSKAGRKLVRHNPTSPSV